MTLALVLLISISGSNVAIADDPPDAESTCTSCNVYDNDTGADAAGDHGLSVGQTVQVTNTSNNTTQRYVVTAVIGSIRQVAVVTGGGAGGTGGGGGGTGGGFPGDGSGGTGGGGTGGGGDPTCLDFYNCESSSPGGGL